MTVDDITAKALAPIDAPLRDGLFDELPDLFAPPFTLLPADTFTKRDWTNRATRLAASKAEEEAAEIAAAQALAAAAGMEVD